MIANHSNDNAPGFIRNDGGRRAAGFTNKATAGDCVARAVAIASGRPYQEVYDALAHGMATQRRTKRSGSTTGKRSASNGVNTKRQWFKDYMRSLGFEWVPTMTIGSGCTVHLDANELPAGRIVVAVSKHYTAMIDGIIHDAYDPRRGGFVRWTDGNRREVAESRCVYGYWKLAD